MPIPLKLKKRKDFVKISKSGVSLATSTIVFQAAKNSNDLENLPRIGYTTTKKIGGAVVRNRCRRRLRAVAAMFFEEYALPKTDYVLIARYSTADAKFETLCKDFKYGIKKAGQLLYPLIIKDKTDVSQNN